MEGWKVKKIEECCYILDSKRIPINYEQREDIVGYVPYYGANGIQGYVNDYIFNDDLILLAEDGGHFDEYSDRPIAYKISGKSWVNNHAHVLKVKNRYDFNFIFYSLEHKNILPFIVGGTRAKLNQSELKSLTLDIPTHKPEQSKIAEILSTVDRAIEQTEALIAKQQRIKTGLMHDLLTRGIDENGNIRSEETHRFKDSPLGRIPVEWEVVDLQSMTLPDSPITYGVVQPGRDDPNGVRFIRGGDVYQGKIAIDQLRTISKSVSDSFKRTLLQGGELLMSLVGYPGEVAIVPRHLSGSNIARQVAIIRLKSNWDAQFVMYYLLSEMGKRRVLGESIGSAQQVVNLKDLRKVFVPKPRREEQAEIRNRILTIFSSIDEMILLMNKFQKLKTALMQDLLTGRVRLPAAMLKAQDGRSKLREKEAEEAGA